MELTPLDGELAENTHSTQDEWKYRTNKTFIDLMLTEFTLEEMKKNFTFPDFLSNLLLSTLPSLWDVLSDVLLAFAFFNNEDDLLLTLLTLLFIFLPGVEWYSYKTQAKRKWRVLFLFSCMFFPVFLLAFKVRKVLPQKKCQSLLFDLLR